jgi:hypothetical protein
MRRTLSGRCEKEKVSETRLPLGCRNGRPPLILRIPGKRNPLLGEQQLNETGAVDPHGGAATPQVRNSHELPDSSSQGGRAAPAHRDIPRRNPAPSAIGQLHPPVAPTGWPCDHAAQPKDRTHEYAAAANGTDFASGGENTAPRPLEPAFRAGPAACDQSPGAGPTRVAVGEVPDPPPAPGVSMAPDLNHLSHEELAAQLATVVRTRPQVEGGQ